jgi:hypothetical protein
LELSVEVPRGITGVRHVDDSPLPLCDLAAFRGHCYSAARALNGRVVSVDASVRAVETNFARAVLEVPTGRVAVLLNAHYPVIAFAEPPVDDKASTHFLDAPDLAKAFCDFGVDKVVCVAQLAAPLPLEQCERLASAEREQIEYWRPQCVGEVVFNFWD